jgi:hypothetical protein
MGVVRLLLLASLLGQHRGGLQLLWIIVPVVPHPREGKRVLFQHCGVRQRLLRKGDQLDVSNHDLKRSILQVPDVLDILLSLHFDQRLRPVRTEVLRDCKRNPPKANVQTGQVDMSGIGKEDDVTDPDANRKRLPKLLHAHTCDNGQGDTDSW